MRFRGIFFQVTFNILLLFPIALQALQAPEEQLLQIQSAPRTVIRPFDPPNIAPLIAVATDNVAAITFYFRGVPSGAHLIMDSTTGATLLHFAALHSPPAMLEALVKSGADPTFPDHDGDTPLHWAASIGDLDVIHMLLALGAEKGNANNNGLLPWHTANHSLSGSDNKDLILRALSEL